MFHVKHFDYPLHIVSRETLRKFSLKLRTNIRRNIGVRIVDRKVIIL